MDSLDGAGFPELKARYAAAVREAFGSRCAPAACFSAARIAWAMEKPSYTALWLGKLDREAMEPGEKVQLCLWEAFLVHLRESMAGEGSFAYTRLRYGKVLAMDPGNFFALFNLGLVFRAEGRKVEAARFLGKALVARPWDRETAKLLEEIRGDLDS
ncbi:MAG TPA: hypothetical protein ENJ97_06035 [Planctomycetes bacterium]|nr:hypothetical protein [Planctomycetota bacterium]